jgi:hypothetical protein
MIVHRRIWSYRLATQLCAQLIRFDKPVTASTARNVLRRSVGNPLELWGRGHDDRVSGDTGTLVRH